jgi:hypothetical protein
MRSIGVACALGLTFAGASRADEPSLAETLEEVRRLDEVDGDRVGYDLNEGRFFALHRVLLAKADDATVGGLLGETNPVARAMGLYVLSQRQGAASVASLRARLTDRATFVEFAGGCCGFSTSVGAFARALLHDANRLRFRQPAKPMVDAPTRLRIDLELLADDRAAGYRRDVVEAVLAAADDGRLVLSLEGLRRAAPGLVDRDLLKAVGRLGRHSGAVYLLSAAAADATLSNEARLAAVSGLTRTDDRAADAAIVEWRARIDASGGAGTADRLRQALDARARPARMGAGDAVHPAALPATPVLLEALASRVPETRAAAVASLFRIARGLGARPAPSWDTDADAPYLLEPFALPRRRSAWTGDGPLTESERKELLALLSPYLVD